MNLKITVNRFNNNDVVVTSSSVLPGFNSLSSKAVYDLRSCGHLFELYPGLVTFGESVTILNEKGDILIDNGRAETSFEDGAYYHYNSTTKQFIKCDDESHHYNSN